MKSASIYHYSDRRYDRNYFLRVKVAGSRSLLVPSVKIAIVNGGRFDPVPLHPTRCRNGVGGLRKLLPDY